MKRTGPLLHRTPLRRKTALSVALESRLNNKARRSKFSNKKQSYDGLIYHSQKEARYAARLDLLMTTADPTMRVAEWKRQVRMPLDVAGVHICNYIVDFWVRFADGREEFHEVKGFATDLWRLKAKLFRACYPKHTLRVL